MSIIPVTKPYLPELSEYQEYVRKIWNSESITNNGPLVRELEDNLKRYCNTSDLFYVCNGTIALQIAIKALDLKGEIITTPFSYVATTSSIVWEGCTPVFTDVEELSLTIDPLKIEEAITDKTTGIIATHVYGIPCDIDSIDKIARKYNLRVIYDAAHCFGVEYKGKPISSYGDISTFSFHATKLFQTIEGGAIIVNNQDYAQKVSYMRNFGHNGQEAFFGVGINGKNSEFHAAMGLCNLPKVEDIIKERRIISEKYTDLLINNSGVDRPLVRENTKYNYSYYPILLKDEETLLSVSRALNSHNIYPRRYFHPSLSELNYVHDTGTPIAKNASKRVLCLPLYVGLSVENVEKICQIILNTIS